MYKFTVKHGDSHLPDFLNGVRRDVLSIKWHVSGLGLRKPNTSEKTPTSSSPLTAERPSDTLTGIRLRHPLPGWTDELLYRHGPLHDGQRNLLVTLVLLHWCILLWGRPSPSQLSTAGSRHRGNKVSLRQGGSFETRTQRRTQAPSCGGEHQWWRASAEVLFMKYSSYYKRLGFKLYSGFYYDI